MSQKVKLALLGSILFLGCLSIREIYNSAILLKTARAENRVLEEEKNSWKAKANQADKDFAKAEVEHQKSLTAVKKKFSQKATVKNVNASRPKGMGEIKQDGNQLVITGDAQANLDAIHKAEESGETCKVNLVSCEQKLAAKAAKDDALTHTNTISEKQTKNIDLAAKGGSWKSKVVKEGKCLLVAGGSAALGAKFKGVTGAAIGAMAGEATCKIFF